MEDDDELRELYNDDGLAPFSDPSASQSHQHPSRSEAAPPPIKNTSTAHANPDTRSNLNLDTFSSLDDEFGQLHTDVPTPNLNRSCSAQTHENIFSPSRVSQDPPLLDRKSDESAASKDAKFVEEDDNRGVQIEQDDDGPAIPGISVSHPNVGALNPNVVPQEEANAEKKDDWKSDSSDDSIRILLNENDHPDETLGPVIGQGRSGYNPYHSRYKYVRPGAAPLPGGSGAVGGRGRGAHFTLPSNNTIFDIDIDTFKEKPWNHPGANVSDFFNYEFNEDSWNDYRRRLKNDPDFPPKLAVVAAGIQDTSIENLNSQRAEIRQSVIGKGTALMGPPGSPTPTGRSIPVVIESNERLFSGDIHPCMRDADSVILLQGSVDDDSSAGHGAKDRQKNDPGREDLRDSAVKEDDKQQSLDRSSHDRDLKRNCPQDVDSHHRKDRGSPDTEKIYKGYERREKEPHDRKYRSEDSWKHRDYVKRRDHFDKDDRKRNIDEILEQRERAERRRVERDDGYRSKQSYEESSSRREREDGQVPSRSRRHAEDKGRTGHSWKDDYKGYKRDSSYKDTGRYSEQRNRKDRVEDESDLHSWKDDCKGYERYSSYGRYSEQCKRKDRVENESYLHSWKDDYKGYERYSSYKDTGRYSEQRKRKDRAEDESDLHYGYKEKRSRQEKSTVRDTSKKPQVERSGREEMADLTGKTEGGNAECGKSDNNEQHCSKRSRPKRRNKRRRNKRLRSKVERWTSNEERDYGADKIPSSSQKLTEKDNSAGSGSFARVRDDVAKKSQAVDIPNSASEGKESGVAKENRHLDTVEKLKKRSERFKLPMPADKNTTPIKKMKSESPSSGPSEVPGSSEVKLERPVRKRLWKC